MVTRVEGTPEELVLKVKAVMSSASAAKSRHVVALLIVDDAEGVHGAATAEEFAQLMAEAEADTVSVGHMDDSREAMYTRMDGE